VLIPPPHLSPSSIGTFNQCPLKFKYSKIDGKQENPTEATLMGNFVHDVIEEFYKHDPEARSILLAKNLASQLWEEKWQIQAEPWVRGQDNLKMFRWKSWWCIENLWKIENPKVISPTGLEHELNGEIGGVRIKGFIDRFSEAKGEGFVISDYKTGKTPKKTWIDDKFFQLLVYSHLLESTGVGKAVKVELLYLKDGVKFHKSVTDEELQSVEKTIVETKAEIDKRCETEEFEAVKSILCNWCSFKKECPAWR
jgi:putative RecB family exonuclease